jgi:hypothetical protein
LGTAFWAPRETPTGPDAVEAVWSREVMADEAD